MRARPPSQPLPDRVLRGPGVPDLEGLKGIDADCKKVYGAMVDELETMLWHDIDRAAATTAVGAAPALRGRQR